MRSEEEVRSKFENLLEQARSNKDNYHIKNVIQQRLTALAWVLEDSRVKELILDDKSIDLMRCFY